MKKSSFFAGLFLVVGSSVSYDLSNLPKEVNNKIESLAIRNSYDLDYLELQDTNDSNQKALLYHGEETGYMYFISEQELD